MTPDDKFFAFLGKVMTVFALVVVVALTSYAIAQLYLIDQSYVTDTTPLLAPDSTPSKKAK
jgi:hypothetical protein